MVYPELLRGMGEEEEKGRGGEEVELKGPSAREIRKLEARDWAILGEGRGREDRGEWREWQWEYERVRTALNEVDPRDEPERKRVLEVVRSGPGTLSA